jgi:hypothetical protein
VAAKLAAREAAAGSDAVWVSVVNDPQSLLASLAAAGGARVEALLGPWLAHDADAAGSAPGAWTAAADTVLAWATAGCVSGRPGMGVGALRSGAVEVAGLVLVAAAQAVEAGAAAIDGGAAVEALRRAEAVLAAVQLPGVDGAGASVDDTDDTEAQTGVHGAWARPPLHPPERLLAASPSAGAVAVATAALGVLRAAGATPAKHRWLVAAWVRALGAAGPAARDEVLRAWAEHEAATSQGPGRLGMGARGCAGPAGRAWVDGALGVVAAAAADAGQLALAAHVSRHRACAP